MSNTSTRSMVLWCTVASVLGWAVGYFGPRSGSTVHTSLTATPAQGRQGFSGTRASQPPPHPSTTAAATNVPQGGAMAISLMSLSEPERTEDLELAQREAEGSYVLATDHNLHRKRIRQIVSNLVQTATQQVTPRYTAKLTELGLDPATTETVLQHLAKIREASLLAEDPLRQLATARQDLKQRLTSVLPPEAYEEFKRFEEAQRGRRDLEQIRADWEKTLGAGLTPERETVLLELMRKTGAYSEPSQHGLYDGLPATATGRQAVKEMVATVLRNLERGYPSFMSQAQEAGFSALELGILRTHYEQRIASQRGSIERLTRPESEEPHRPPSRSN